MDWQDQGILLSVRRHGESAAIIEVFTKERGRHLGVVRGGASRKLAPILQPGAQIEVEWRARLEEHMGSFRVEPVLSRAALVLNDRTALSALSAICSLICFSLPEREQHPRLYHQSHDLLDQLTAPEIWPLLYLQWELALLEDTGFGLDFSSCAVTGEADNLAFVSPKSGRAVSRIGAGEWAERLLPLPACMQGSSPASHGEILEGLRTTGYFLQHWLARSLGERPIPDARGRLVSNLAK